MILILLITSAVVNLLFIWYVYHLLKKLLFVSDGMGEFLDTLQNYSEHIERIYNMETYYGDETIEQLLEHSKEIVKELRAYEEIYTLLEDDQEEEEALFYTCAPRCNCRIYIDKRYKSSNKAVRWTNRPGLWWNGR